MYSKGLLQQQKILSFSYVTFCASSGSRYESLRLDKIYSRNFGFIEWTWYFQNLDDDEEQDGATDSNSHSEKKQQRTVQYKLRLFHRPSMLYAPPKSTEDTKVLLTLPTVRFMSFNVANRYCNAIVVCVNACLFSWFFCCRLLIDESIITRWRDRITKV